MLAFFLSRCTALQHPNSQHKTSQFQQTLSSSFNETDWLEEKLQLSAGIQKVHWFMEKYLKSGKIKAPQPIQHGSGLYLIHAP